MNYEVSYFDKWEVLTFPQFFRSNAGRGREDELEEYVTCHVCSNHLLMNNIEEGRIIKWKPAFPFNRASGGLFAVCSESCFNTYVLQNL